MAVKDRTMRIGDATRWVPEGSAPSLPREGGAGADHGFPGNSSRGFPGGGVLSGGASRVLTVNSW
jgi:hypothetical protein